MRLMASTAIATILLAASVQAGPTVPTRNNADGYLVDTAGALPAPDAARINAKLLAYKARTTNEFAVVIVKDLGDSDIKEYANTLFHTWGIGLKGKDNGVLFLWSLKERKIRLEVGYGLEGQLPDGRAGIIIRDIITPAFKAQRWTQGVEGGVDAVIAQLDLVQKTEPVKAAAAATGGNDWAFILGFLVLGGAVVAFFIWYTREPDPITTFTPPQPRVFPPAPSVYNDYSQRPKSSLPQSTAKRAAVVPVKEKRKEPERRREPEPTYIPVPYSPAPSYDSGSSYSGGSSDSGSFGGGDSGGGGADGGY